MIVIALVVTTGLIMRGSPKTPAYHGTPVAAPTIQPSVWYGVKWPAHPAALFLGDSWTFGTGATVHTDGWAWDAGRAMHIHYFVSGIGSTGWVNPGGQKPPVGNYRTRLASLPPLGFAPNVVILQGSINDDHYAGTQTLFNATVATIDEVHRKYPGAVIVIVGPLNINGVPNSKITGIAEEVSQAAYYRHVPFIDPQREAWFSGPNHPLYVNPADNHPSDEGHALFAQRFLQDLEVLKAHHVY